MTGLHEDDVEPDPIAQFLIWYEEAEAEAVALATASVAGDPSVRMVLLKGVDQRGFTFYTNYDSAKAHDLAVNPRAALCFFWPPDRQVRVSGSVETVEAAESERYWRNRPRASQLSAWASRQSQVVESREMLEQRVAELAAHFGGGDVPLPPFWGGYRLVPEVVEFCGPGRGPNICPAGRTRGELSVSGYVIFHAEVTDPVAYEEFKQRAEAAIAKHGGRYLVRGGAVEALEGNWLPRMVLLEFESLEAALAFYHSDEYSTAREIRLPAATANLAAVAGVEDEREQMATLIRRYFDACNAGDVDGIAACFVPDAVHYFPPGMYDGPFRGARTIAERWRAAVETLGSYWTIDRMVCDRATHQAVIEWTHFKTKQGTVLRGDEWYLFDPDSGLIREIRAYYAAPQDKSLARLELGGYDYVGAGYATAPPPGER